MAMAQFGKVYVAAQSFSCLLNGEQVSVDKGDTAREGHPILEHFGMYFVPQRVKFEHLVPTQAPVKKPAGRAK